MAEPVMWGYEFFCEKCHEWHRASQYRRVDYYSSPYYGWTATYISPCGEEYVCHGEDPAYGVRAIYLEDHFRRKRAILREDSNVCPDCLAVLKENREAFWNCWQWQWGNGQDPHLRVGPPGMGGDPLCQLR